MQARLNGLVVTDIDAVYPNQNQGNHFGVEAKKKNGDNFGVGISFRMLYNYIYLQSSYRNKRAKGYQV